jgi:hypothetical protein
MKTKFIPLLVLLAIPGFAQTNLSYVNLSVSHTNATSGAGTITVSGWFTNATYTITNPVAVTTGDYLSTAFGKANNNWAFLQAEIVTNILNWSTMQAQFTATNALITAEIHRVETNGLAIATNLFYQAGLDATNYADQIGLNASNITITASADLTNLVMATGLDLTNRLTDIKLPGSSGSETVLKVESPDGTPWYLHVDNSGTLTVTGSP